MAAAPRSERSGRSPTRCAGHCATDRVPFGLPLIGMSAGSGRAATVRPASRATSRSGRNAAKASGATQNVAVASAPAVARA